MLNKQQYPAQSVNPEDTMLPSAFGHKHAFSGAESGALLSVPGPVKAGNVIILL